jgi:hypothetical protein
MSRALAVETRQCVYCGHPIRTEARQCLKCRETQPEVRMDSPRPRSESSGHLRKGLLLILLASVVYYFAGGHSPLEVPDRIAAPMRAYVMPMLYLAGFATSLWGVATRLRS